MQRSVWPEYRVDRRSRVRHKGRRLVVLLEPRQPGTTPGMLDAVMGTTWARHCRIWRPTLRQNASIVVLPREHLVHFGTLAGRLSGYPKPPNLLRPERSAL